MKWLSRAAILFAVLLFSARPSLSQESGRLYLDYMSIVPPVGVEAALDGDGDLYGADDVGDVNP